MCTAIFITPDTRDEVYYWNLEDKLITDLRNWLKEYGERQFNNKLMTCGEYLALSSNVARNETMEGSKIQIRQQINTSNIRRPPLIIPRNIEVDMHDVPSMPLFKESKPSYIINIGTIDQLNYTLLNTDVFVNRYSVQGGQICMCIYGK